MFARQLRSLDPFRELTDDDVRTAIKNSSGVAGVRVFGGKEARSGRLLALCGRLVVVVFFKELWRGVFVLLLRLAVYLCAKRGD